MKAPQQEEALELGKAGFAHAQNCIQHIDAKVGVAVGVLVFLLPFPLVALGWLTGLEGDTSQTVLKALVVSPFLLLLVVGLLTGGMIFAVIALYKGMQSLTPRPPKGFDKVCRPFHNEWKPNILFPILPPSNVSKGCVHFERLKNGVDFDFVVGEYINQLEQLGCILAMKIGNMKTCFWGLRNSLICYAIAIAIGLVILALNLLESSSNTGQELGLVRQQQKATVKQTQRAGESLEIFSAIIIELNNNAA